MSLVCVLGENVLLVKRDAHVTLAGVERRIANGANYTVGRFL